MSARLRVGVNLRASAFLHQGSRKYMEDECEVAYQRTANSKDIEYAYFGIFDGHGGKEAAIYAKDNLMDQIVAQRAFWSDDDDEVLSAIREGFIQTHHAMWRVVDQWPKTPSGWPSTSGTTATIAFIRRHKIYIGHVGDSGIVLGYDDGGGTWNGESLTRDHKPESIQENRRITDSGGKVVYKSGVPRVVWNRPKLSHQGPVRRSTPMDEIPFLAVARSLGDLWSYNATNNQFVVSPEPDVCVVDIDITRHRCLIFGTDGLWNALSAQTAVNLAYATEKNNEIAYISCQYSGGEQRKWINPSTSIVCGALERYKRISLRADNTSAITVYIDAPGKPKREKLLATFEGQRSGTKGFDKKGGDSPLSANHVGAAAEKEDHHAKRDHRKPFDDPSTSTESSSGSLDEDEEIPTSPACPVAATTPPTAAAAEVTTTTTTAVDKDIQSPEVSSTTGLKDDVSTPIVKMFMKRRLRSSISPVKENDDDLQQTVDLKMDASYPTDTPLGRRVLKSVNSNSSNNYASLPHRAAKVNVSLSSSSSKRKLAPVDDSKNNSSKRISTRSSVRTAKPMVTRSQDKGTSRLRRK